MKNIFRKKKQDKAEQKPKIVISVKVMQGTSSDIVMDRFDILVSQAIDMILAELKMPKMLDKDSNIKYFLYRKSARTVDGWEIIAEIGTEGLALTLNDHEIYENAQLELGAMVIKTGVNETMVEGNETNKHLYEDTDNEITEV